MKRDFCFLCLLMPAILLFLGCQAMMTGTAKVTAQAEKTGVISPEKSQSINKSAENIAEADAKRKEEFTPEQEYYLGRSVAAVILSKYPPYANQPANEYLNLIGQALAQVSEMPEIFLGYRVLLLNSDEINAFATPGGHIFITRGLLRCCRTEDAVAAVLAHEIGHIQLKHGIQAIKQERTIGVLKTVATEIGGEKLLESFSGAIGDFTNMMINTGYSRPFEYAADDVAQTLLRRLGYDPNGLVEVLMVMDKKLKPDDAGFGKTHPAPQDRIEKVQKKTGVKYSPVLTPNARQARYMKALGNI
jgi:beta-barrel assembly-enhancing protease